MKSVTYELICALTNRRLMAMNYKHYLRNENLSPVMRQKMADVLRVRRNQLKGYEIRKSIISKYGNPFMARLVKTGERPSEFLRKWLDTVVAKQELGERVSAKGLTPETTALVHFEVGQVEAGLRQIGLESSVPDFDVPFGTILYDSEHLKTLEKLVSDLAAQGL